MQCGMNSRYCCAPDMCSQRPRTELAIRIQHRVRAGRYSDSISTRSACPHMRGNNVRTKNERWSVDSPVDLQSPDHLSDSFCRIEVCRRDHLPWVVASQYLAQLY